MPVAELTADTLHVRLSRAEKVAGLLGDLRVPLLSVTSVEVVEDGLAATRGIRAPGLHLPGRTKYGTWRRRGGKQYVAVRRGVPALRLSLQDHDYAGAVVSVPDAHRLAERLRAAR